MITSSDDYHVEVVPIEEVMPSPENDDIYGEVKHDEQMEALMDSIKRRGLEEPIIVSADNYVISGHRRLFACRQLGFDSVPVRRKQLERLKWSEGWHAILTEYNPQRIKSPLTLLKEAMLRYAENDPRDLLEQWEDSGNLSSAEFTEVDGYKKIGTVSSQRMPFMEAAKAVIHRMLVYWPLTVRQVHYQLLNSPPPIRVSKKNPKGKPSDLYKNDKRSYDALVRLLKDARYTGLVPLECIDDPTRPNYHQQGYHNLSEFLDMQMQEFLTGYHRDRQVDQPRHIEVLGEKATLVPIIKSVCAKYYVPLSLARGYGGPSLWKQIAARYKRSGKKQMTLIVVSDYDPEGLDLPRDAIRSLRDIFGVPVDYHRVGVTRDQIDELDLADDFNPAKPESSRLESFIEETGGEDTWECESLPPEYLKEQVAAAIEANMDMDLYRRCEEIEEEEAEELHDIRQQMVDDLGI